MLGQLSCLLALCSAEWGVVRACADPSGPGLTCLSFAPLVAQGSPPPALPSLPWGLGCVGGSSQIVLGARSLLRGIPKWWPSRISRHSRINTSPPSLSRVPAFLLLSAVYGVPYYQSSPPSPLRKYDQRPLNSSRSCQKGSSLASPNSSGSLTRDACSSGPTWQTSLSSWGRRIHPSGEMVLVGMGLEGHSCFHPNHLPDSPETASSPFCLLN